MINSNFIIVSSISVVPRSVSDILDVSITGTPINTISTALLTEEEYNQYTNVILSNSGVVDQVGALSLDGLYVPYSTRYDYDSIIPRLTSPSSTGIDSYRLNPFNPDFMFGTGVIVETVDSGGFNADVWENGGHNINSAMIASDYSSVGSIESGLHPSSNQFDADFYYRQKVELTNIRSIAYRTPSVWSGWGYDVNDSPVPANTGDPSLLHPEALWNTSLWKTGPLDIRWDESRGVWSAGGSAAQIVGFQIVSSDPTSRRAIGLVTEKAFEGAVHGALLEGDHPPIYIWDSDGCYLTEPNVDLTARRGKAILMYINNDTLANHSPYMSNYGEAVGDKYWNVLSLCCPEVICEGTV